VQIPTNHVSDYGSQVLYEILFRVAQVDRLRVVAAHQQDKTVNEIAYVLKRARLSAIAVDLSSVNRSSIIRLESIR
jgi:hypothetical protein